MTTATPASASIPDALTDAIAVQINEDYPDLGERMTGAVVRSVLLKASDAVLAVGGDPVGMIRRDTASGALATRVLRDGIPMWEITRSGVISYDMSPRLSWPVLYTPPLED